MEDNQPVSVGDWLVTFLLLCVPVLNIVLIVYWAIWAPKESKRNFFRAQLLLLLLVGGAILALSVFAPAVLQNVKLTTGAVAS